MNLRRLCVLLAMPTALTLSACTSSGGGGSTVGTSSPDGTPATAATLSAQLKSAIADVTSADLDLDITLVGQALSGRGAEQLRKGDLIALDLTENLPGGAGAIRVIVAGGKTYAKLPLTMNASGKPYLLVTPNSSNTIIKQLAASLDTALSSASLGNVSVFVGAAKTIDVRGTETVAGVSATHYSVVVDIAKLPASLPGRDELVASGADTIPLELYVDDHARPVQVGETLKLQGQDVSSESTVTGYDKPVSITAPPPGQVGG